MKALKILGVFVLAFVLALIVLTLIGWPPKRADASAQMDAAQVAENPIGPTAAVKTLELPLTPIAKEGAPVMVEAIPVNEWRIVSREPAMASWVSDRFPVECTLLALSPKAPTALVTCKGPEGRLYPSFPSQVTWYTGS